jgi:hypothetical protein
MDRAFPRNRSAHVNIHNIRDNQPADRHGAGAAIQGPGCGSGYRGHVTGGDWLRDCPLRGTWTHGFIGRFGRSEPPDWLFGGGRHFGTLLPPVAPAGSAPPPFTLPSRHGTARIDAGRCCGPSSHLPTVGLKRCQGKAEHPPGGLRLPPTPRPRSLVRTRGAVQAPSVVPHDQLETCRKPASSWLP